MSVNVGVVSVLYPPPLHLASIALPLSLPTQMPSTVSLSTPVALQLPLPPSVWPLALANVIVGASAAPSPNTGFII